MNILFDINHPVDVNFFKNAMLQLKKDGHKLHIIFRGRGKLEKILRYELSEFPITQIGEHSRGFLKKVITQLNRDYNIIPYLKKNKFDLVVCFGPTSAISAWVSHKPYLAFDDDIEYRLPFYHANLFSTRHIFPDFIKFSNSKTHKYHGFKELAYLHPNYLKISDEILNDYSLKENMYVFIREISAISLNYKERNSILDQIIDTIKNRGLSVVLSLENKELHQVYTEAGCVVLQEPVRDIYSLMYHALFSVSSGDTVARETSLLGLPTLYTGGRNMAVNTALIEAGALHALTDTDIIINWINKITDEDKMKCRQRIFNLINNKWEDTTSIILNQISDFEKLN